MVPECCGGSCVDLAVDNLNCGACNEACPVGSACDEASLGSGALGLPLCEELGFPIVQCSSSFPCPKGYGCDVNGYCDSLTCGPLDEGAACLVKGSDAQGNCCSGTCVNLQQNANNCGACGASCGPGGKCSQFMCTVTACTTTVPQGSACKFGDGGEGTCCGTTCADLSSDPANCSQCSNACGTGFDCSLSTCVLATCEGTFSESNCEFENGTSVIGRCCDQECVNIQTDNFNCGQCGKTCVSGVQCTNASCN